MSKHRLAILWGLCLLGVWMGCGQDKYRRPSAERYFEEGKKALLKRKCWNAQQLFRNLLSDFPGSYLVDEAQYHLGQAYYCSKDYVEAIFEYERLLNEFPTSPFVDEARYQIGMCYYKQSRGIHHDQGETEKAIREFRRFIEDFPNSELVVDAQEQIRELRSKLASQRLMIAENYLTWDNALSTERYCEIILNEFPDTDVVFRARFLMARAQYQMEKLDEALEVLTLLASDEISDGLKQEVEKEVQKVQGAIAKRALVSPVPDEEAESEKGPVDGK